MQNVLNERRLMDTVLCFPPLRSRSRPFTFYNTQIVRKSAQGAARDCQNRWGNLTTQPPHGLCALLKTMGNSTMSVISCFPRRAAVTVHLVFAFFPWSAPSGNPIMFWQPRAAPCAALFRLYNVQGICCCPMPVNASWRARYVPSVWLVSA